MVVFLRGRSSVLVSLLVLAGVLFGSAGTAAPATASFKLSDYATVAAHRWGPIRFGETLQAARERGAEIRFDRRQHTWTQHGCGLAAVRAEDRTVGWVMVWKVDGREVVVRTSFAAGDPYPAVTATGVSLGMTETALLARADRYGWDIVVEQHPYGARGDHKITHRVRVSGVSYAYVYDTFTGRDSRRRVVVMYAGKRAAARAVDGCYSSH